MHKLNTNIIFGIGIVGLLCLFVIRLLLVNNGFNTLYDEAFFLFALQDAYDGVIVGTTQWNHIAICMFPFFNLVIKGQAYVANIILSLLTAGVVIGICKWRFTQAPISKIAFFALLSSLLFLYVNQELTYVSLQTFFFACSLALYVVQDNLCCEWKRVSCWLLMGVLALFELLTILPSGFLINIAFVVLIAVKEWRTPLMWLKKWGLFVVGILLGALFCHFCIVNLVSVFGELQGAVQATISNVNHHSPLLMLFNLVRFGVDWVFVLLLLVGVYVVSSKIVQKTKWTYYVASAVLVVLIVLYSIIQKKPHIEPAMIFSAIVFLPLLFDKSICAEVRGLYDWLLLIFMILFPIIASLGTDVYIGNRMGCFMMPWIMLFVWMDELANKNLLIYKSVCIAGIIVVLLTFKPVLLQFIHPNTVSFTKGNPHFSETKLTTTQVDYFNNVLNLMNQYGFDKDNSEVFVLNEDYATAYAFDIKNKILVYGPERLYPIEKYKAYHPDFIFIQDWEAEIGDKNGIMTAWGWPEEFDKYEVGTPDPNGPYKSERNLYCRRKIDID